MTRLRAVVLIAAMAVTAGVAAVPVGAAPAAPARGSADDLRPMVFVHGFLGSGAQFETQAKRFTSNGYPPEYIQVHEYDTNFGVETEDAVFARLDGVVTDLIDETGADAIDLLGHSLGTRLMQTYLRSTPERATRVAHYVNLDGMPGNDPPGGVDTLAVWGRGDPAREITGATNVRFADQTHTQVVTSPQTFETIYEFFNDEDPKTSRIVPQRKVDLSGRAVLFPQNVGVETGDLEIYEIDAESGARLDEKPEATFPLAGDGAWGPFVADGRKRYEFTIVRDGAAVHHLYFEPFIRSDRWIRLLTSPVEGGIGDLINASDAHAALVILRYKELWGDQGDRSDVLEINGDNILNEANAPIDKRAIALFVFDDGDGATDLTAPLPAFASLPFISGADVFVPASASGDGTISVISTPRGGGGKIVTLSVPDWPSSDHRVSIQLSDHLQAALRPTR